MTVPCHHDRLCPGPQRRGALQAGGLAALRLSLPGLWHHQSAAASVRAASGGRAKSCIVLFMLGGPDQHSTFDPKPSAPAGVRGEFSAISTVVPGISLGELWPKTATITDRLAILRAVSTGDNAHSSSGYYMLTGQPHVPMNVEGVNPGFPNDFPTLGATVRHFRDAGRLPSAVRLPHHIWNTDGSVWPGQDAGFLGQPAEPWLLNCRPAETNFQIEELSDASGPDASRRESRRQLLQTLQRSVAGGTGSEAQEYDRLSARAFDVLNSDGSRKAFDLEREPESLRERYGRSQFGQSVLMSRRLVEAGVSLVQVNWFRGPDEPSDAPCWDSHVNEAKRLKSVLCPPADQAFAALLSDLQDRGLLEETLVVMMAEFGRSPRLNGAAGRDHWGHVFSVALAGGGIRGGIVHGESDAQGAYPLAGRVTPQDLTATIFHCLGLAPESEIHDSFGRPLPISRGRVIEQILA